MLELLREYEPIATAVTALLSLAVLGFIVRFAIFIRSAFLDRIEATKAQMSVLEERMKLKSEELERNEKWYERRIEDLQSEIGVVLDGQNITSQRIIEDPLLENISSEIRASITETLNQILALERSAKSLRDDEHKNPEWLLQRAKAFTLTQHWKEAAQCYGEYLIYVNDDWNVYFLRGIALANSREGREAYIEAVRSLGGAIAYLPDDADLNLRARLHGYRGADFKRIGRLKEAESELKLALQWANKQYEIDDINYNLSCVYSMMNDKENMLVHLARIVPKNFWRNYIASRREYFENHWKDSDFRRMVGLK